MVMLSRKAMMGEQRAAQGYDWYVDSVNGNDANTGDSPTEAFKTLAAVEAVVSSNETVALARDSVFDNERLFLSGDISGVTLRDYGEGDKPVIDGSGVITGWSKTAGLTNIYEKTLSLPADASSVATTFENGDFMARVSDAAACDSTPGSYTAINELTDTITVYIHASDSGDPNTNGDEYRVAQQICCLYCNDAADISAYNIVFRRSRFQSGSVFGSKRFYAEGCEIRQGVYHNAVIALDGTSTLKNCIVADIQSSVSTTLVAFYQPVTDANDHIVVDGCTFSNANGKGTGYVGGFNYHDNGASVLGSVIVTNTEFIGMTSSPCGPNSNTPIFTFTGNTLTNCGAGVAIPTGVTAEIDDLTSGGTTGINLYVTGGTVSVSNATLSGGTDGIQVTGGVVEINNCTVAGATRGYNLDSPVTLTSCAAITCGRGYDVDNAIGTVELIDCSDTGSTVVGLDKAGTGALTVSGASSFGPSTFTAGAITLTGTVGTNIIFESGTLAQAININGAPTVTLTHVTSIGNAVGYLAALWVQGGAAVVNIDGGVYTVSDNESGNGARSVYVTAGIGATISIQNAYIKCRYPVRVLGGGATPNVIAACDFNRYGVSALIWDDPVAGSFAGLANWQAGTAWDDNSIQDPA